MPRNTNHGKAYSIDELLRLGSINSFGPYNGALMGALSEAKSMRVRIELLEKQNTELKAALSESMHDRFISEIRKDSTGSKKDK